MKLAIVPLLMVSIFACAEEQQIALDIATESKPSTYRQDWNEAKISSQQALQNWWDISKEESTQLWQQGKNESSELLLQGKKKSTALWQQGKEKSQQFWGELQSDSQKTWSEGKLKMQQLFKNEDQANKQSDKI